jgi:enamine deaminase RidA (YjgF/YER057c/UK114 family)
MSKTATERLAELSITLPPAPPRGGVYKPCLVVDNKFLYVSGHGPYQSDKTNITGRVGADLDIDQGKQAARQVGLAILASVAAHLGSIDKIKRVVKTLGMVNCTPEFERHPYVINGCSELFAEIWGEENGIGVRSAVGMGSLPSQIAVEIEVIFELNTD